MNTRLLSIIKSEQERRNAPAVIAMNKKTGRESPYEKTGLGKLWIVLRGVKDAFNMLSRLSSLERKQILLPGKGHKHVEVEEEIFGIGLFSEAPFGMAAVEIVDLVGEIQRDESNLQIARFTQHPALAA